MTYNVFSGTLNPTHFTSLRHSAHKNLCCFSHRFSSGTRGDDNKGGTSWPRVYLETAVKMKLAVVTVTVRPLLHWYSQLCNWKGIWPLRNPTPIVSGGFLSRVWQLHCGVTTELKACWLAVGVRVVGMVLEINVFSQWYLATVLEVFLQHISASDLCLCLLTGWSCVRCRLVSTYLIHHGYCSTAESFVQSTGETFDEELVSIRNRQSESMHCA